MKEAPDIRIDSAARHWLLKQDTGVMIRPSPRNGCCGGQALVPVAERGRPRQPADYRQVDIDGVSVFLSRQLPETARLHLRLESLLGWKRLFVDGIGLETPLSPPTLKGA